MFNKAAKPRSPQSSEPNSAHEAAVDRLIELASDTARPAAQGGESLAIQPPASRDSASMWKTLSHLKSLLPYVSKLLPLLDARFLPLLELVGAGHPQIAALTKEMNENLTRIDSGQLDLRHAVDEQSLDIKQLESQIVQLREVWERQSQEQADLLQEVRSMGSLIRAVGAGLAVLLVILILVAGAFLARSAR